MTSKIFISVGHGGSDVGAVAIDGSYEKDIALEIALNLRSELNRHGVEVAMSREKDETDKVASEVKECNSFGPDYGISIHLNACASHGASGFEIYHAINPKSAGISLAKNINDVVVENGVKSRGLKTRVNNRNKDYYAWIRDTAAPVVLCEIGFIDNKENYAQLDNADELKEMATYLAEGILRTLGVKYVPEVKELYTVQCGVFSVKENALALADKLKKDGYNAIVTVR